MIDGNDNAPVFEGAQYTTMLPEGTFDVRQEIITINATDADSGTNAEITYSIAGGTSGNFQIDPQTVSSFHFKLIMLTLSKYASITGYLCSYSTRDLDTHPFSCL